VPTGNFYNTLNFSAFGAQNTGTGKKTRFLLSKKIFGKSQDILVPVPVLFKRLIRKKLTLALDCPFKNITHVAN
jgi:hypothetical protein